MGFISGQARYIIRMCVENYIRGSVATLGRLDFFISMQEFNALMADFDLASIQGDSLSFHDQKIDQRVHDIIQSGKHINQTFKNKDFVDLPIISDTLFYTALGFETIDSIDISDRENASICFDLNQPDILSVVKQPYDLVIDGGTMEHVFDVRGVFRNITDLLKIDGCVLHISPGNNTYDHGFYQFSPTLFHDYYKANRYDVLNIEILELQKDKYHPPQISFVQKWNRYRNWTYDPVLMGRNSFGQLGDAIYFSLACARKRDHSLRDVVPTQYLFSPNHQRILSPWE